MAWTKYQIGLSLLLVITGSINTLSTKWADMLEAVNSAGDKKVFNHPFLQALSMFIGEMLCLLTFKALYFTYKRRGDGSEDVNDLTKGGRQFNPFILMIPAMCDMVATSIMYIGLNLTYASSFQMFRGSVIIFVGLLSVAFLGRKLKVREWLGMGTIIVGLVVVGLSDFMTDSGSSSRSTNDIITGDLLIVVAQVITSIQMVVEEKFVAGLDIPALQAVGWEGLFGFSVLAILQIPFYYIYVGQPFSDNPNGTLEDVLDGFTQMGNNPLIIVATLGTVFSIAFFNFAGISVTKEISATTRMVLDSVRTLVIWLFSLAVFNQKFEWLQLLGFAILLAGMCLYNNIPFWAPFFKIKDCCTKRQNYGDMNESQIQNTKADEAVTGSSSSIVA